MFLRSLTFKGTEGRVTIPSIGVMVGHFSGWTLSRPEGQEGYSFSGLWGRVNPALWSAKDRDGNPYHKVVLLQAGKDKKYELEADLEAAEFTVNELRIERCRVIEAGASKQ